MNTHYKTIDEKSTNITNNIGLNINMSKIIIFLILLFALNFLNLQRYLFIILTGVFALYTIIHKKSIVTNLEMCILLLFSLSYCIFYSQYNSYITSTVIQIGIFPVVSYSIGLNLYRNCKDMGNKIIWAIVIGLFINGALNMYLFYQAGENLRVVPQFWSGEILVATLNNCFFMMMASLLYISIFIIKKHRVKIILWICIGFGMVSSISTASRTLIYVTILVFMLNLAIHFYLNSDKASENLNIVLKASFLVLIIITMFSVNAFNLKDKYESSALSERFKTENLNMDNEPRFITQLKVLGQVFEHPFGDKKIDLYGLDYAHNMWLDTLYSVGIFPFIFLSIYSLLTIRRILKIIKNRYLSIEDTLILFSVTAAVNINFFLEPILEGLPYYFVLMCMINGVAFGKYSIENKKIDNMYNKKRLVIR